MPHILQTATLGAPYKRKCGNTTFYHFIVREPECKEYSRGFNLADT